MIALQAHGRVSTIPRGTVAVLLTALAMVALILTGRLLILAALVTFMLFALVAFYRPVPAIVLAILLSTNVLQFVDLSYLPYVQLARGARLNAQDLVLGLLLTLGVIQLKRRRERPLFLTSLLLFGVMILISYAVGIVARTTDVSSGLNALRTLSGYLFYLALVGVVDTPRRLRAIVWSLLMLVLISVVLQAIEASMGQRLTIPTSVPSEYFSSTVLLDVAGLSAPYLWNRAVGCLFVGFFLGVGGLLWKWNLRDALLVLLAVIGFIIALIRQWYVILVLGVLVIMLLPRKRRLRAVIGMLTILLALAGLITITNPTGWLSSYSLVEVWLARLTTIVNFQQQANFVGRVDIWQADLQLFAQAPLVGYGPGSLNFLHLNVPGGFSDVGLPNTLLQFGLFGLAAIVVLIVTFFRRASALYQWLPHSIEQGYVAGLIGAWVGCVAGYSFGFDFFTSGGTTAELTFAVGLLMAMLDRLNAFARATTDGGG